MTTVRKWLIRWLQYGLIGTLILVVVGGITRLTDSGLSITQWDVIMGVIPPLNHDDWQAAYSRYQQFPQYKLTQTATSLQDFKIIFFWEYLHRLLGRFLGLVLILPLIIFQMKKWLTKKQSYAFSILVFLGISQALMGWYMVKSGLVDVPNVSHYRLSGHLGLALIIVGFLFLLIQTLRFPEKRSFSNKQVLFWGFLSVLVFIQSVWGAFVAGLDAGLVYNTYPKMNNDWIPLFSDSLISFLTNQVSGVQFLHRLLGHFILIGSVLAWTLHYYQTTDAFTKNPVFPLLISISIQVALGISVLLLRVPIVLAVLHQLIAFIVWLSCLDLLHQQLYKHNDLAFKPATLQNNLQ